jgi:hypothetical protein
MSAESVALVSREGGRAAPQLVIKTKHTVVSSPLPTLPLPTDSVLPSPSDTPSPSTSPTPSTTPTPIGQAVITSITSVFTQPQVGKPGYLSSFTDPVFGTTIERIAGNAGSSISFANGSTGTWGSDARQHYNDDQAWNADGSMLWIENASGGSPSRIILDGNTYQPLMKPCSNYSYYDDRWSPTMPHVRVFRNGSTVGWFDIVSCTLLRSWTLPLQTTIDSEAGPSRDGSMWAQGDAATGKILAIRMDPTPGLVGPAYDAQTNCGLSNCTIDHVAISPSGHYILVHYEGDHDRIFDVNPTTLALTPHVYPAGTSECSGRDPSIGSIFDLGHSDLTFDANRDDIAVGQNRSWCPQTVGGVSLGQIYSVRLKDGKVTSLIRTGTAQSYHVSCRNFDRAGWCYAWFWPASGKVFSNEVIAVKTDGSGQVERLANVHTDTNGCYRCESHPVPSRDGMRVLFASSWSVDCGTTCGTQSNPQVYVIDSRSLTRS